MGADEGYFRLWNPDWCNGTIDDCRRVNVHGKFQTTFEIAVSEAASAAAELGTAADAAFYGGRPPRCTVTCGAATTTVTGDHFYLYKADGDGTETFYYVWLNEAVGGKDPAPTGGTGLEVAIGAADDASTVAGKVKVVIDGTGGLTATVAAAIIKIESDAVGPVTPAVDVNTGYAIVNDYQGSYQTYCKLFAYSSQADDTDESDKDARKVMIIGISVSDPVAAALGTEKPQYSVEQVSLAGATFVETTRYYKRVMHMYVCDWGSAGAEAKGNIKLIDTDTATGHTYLTIDADANESNSSGLVYVADGFWGRWKRCYISMNDAAIAV